MKFSAKLGLNTRDVHGLSPKVVLREVINLDTLEEFRDHCWVKLTKPLLAILPTDNSIELLIEFTAEPKSYYKGQETLYKIENIAIGGSFKKPKKSKSYRKA